MRPNALGVCSCRLLASTCFELYARFSSPPSEVYLRICPSNDALAAFLSASLQVSLSLLVSPSPRFVEVALSLDHLCLCVCWPLIVPGAALPIGGAYFQVIHHNVEAEAARLHREGDLYREKLKKQKEKVQQNSTSSSPRQDIKEDS